MPFGQHQDMELWTNQFPDTKILGLPVSRRMRALVHMASTYLSPEPTILLACGWDQELWFGPAAEVRDSRTSRQI